MSLRSTPLMELRRINLSICSCYMPLAAQAGLAVFARKTYAPNLKKHVIPSRVNEGALSGPRSRPVLA